jgi:hypothetical protein
MSISTIDLVLKDSQSVGKGSLDLMDTINAKKRWMTIYRRVNKFLKESHLVTRFAKERASLLILMTLMTFHFLERLTVIIVVL